MRLPLTMERIRYGMLVNEKDAEFICHAVNCHEELVNLLKVCIEIFDSDMAASTKNICMDRWIPAVRDVLKKAGVE